MAAPIPLYVECPHCEEVLSLEQGGEWDHTNPRWTDGKNVNWKLRDCVDELFRGYDCGELFWKSAVLHTSSSASARIRNEAREDQPPYCHYLENEPYWLKRALTEGFFPDAGHELALRVRLWWSFNNPFRPLLSGESLKERCQLMSATVRRCDDFASNAQKLVTLLDDSEPRERVLLAELYRECGHFDAAITLLQQTAELFYTLQQFEHERDRLRQEKSKREWTELLEEQGNTDILDAFDFSPRTESVILIARRVMECSLNQDALVRTIETKVA